MIIAEDSRCSTYDQIMNAQDAGAIGVIFGMEIFYRRHVYWEFYILHRTALCSEGTLPRMFPGQVFERFASEYIKDDSTGKFTVLGGVKVPSMDPIHGVL